jgi:N-acyl amino acid synthase of PEP-CTERM/exosortase system
MLRDHFDRYFEIRRAVSPAEREEAFRLRYAVYCTELQFEPAAAFPDGMERDACDDGAVFALLHYKATGRTVGCVRMIPGQAGADARLPFERVCAGRLDPSLIDLSALDRERSGEISRLAVHADFRRREGEWRTAESVGTVEQSTTGARRYPLVPMGLFLAAAALGLNLGLNQVFVLMEPRLARLLSLCGLRFTQLGDIVEYHGRRGPFRIDRASLLQGLNEDAQALLASFRQRLA